MTARDDVIEAVARILADLEPGEDWPTNEELGGNLTGTRDDEYHSQMLEQARAVRDAVLDEVIATVDASPAVTWAGSGGAKERIRGMKGGTE